MINTEKSDGYNTQAVSLSVDPEFYADPPIIPGLLDIQTEDEGTPEKGFQISISPHNATLITLQIADFQEAVKETYKGLIDEEITDAPSTIQRDPQSWLAHHPTQRGHEILYLMMTGAGNKEIASTLGISDNTVKNHITSILKKMGAIDRLHAINQAIDESIIEPLLVDFDVDFAGYSTLTDREHQIYTELVQGGASNLQLRDRLCITEQTVKNHMTALLTKLGLTNRNEIKFYELKRQEKVMSQDRNSLGLSKQNAIILTLLAREASMPAREFTSPLIGPNLKMPHVNPNMISLYQKLGVYNLVECTAAALLYGFDKTNKFMSSSMRQKLQSLTPQQLQLLLTYGSFGDNTPLKTRANYMGMDVSDLRARLTAALQEAELPSLYQAISVVKHDDLKTAQEDLQRRIAYVESLERRAFTQATPDENDEFNVFNDDGFNSF